MTEPSLTLFGAPSSGAAAVEMALQAAGLPYTLHRAASWEADSDLAALRAVNPLLQIPTLVLPDGTVLTESAAILIHLALQHPQAQLLPEDASQRALALRGLVYIATNCYSAVSISDYPERWTTATDDPARQAVRAATRANLHRAWEVFADTFGGQPVLMAEPPGALAMLAVVISQWSGTRAHLKAQRPQFMAQIEALSAHPRLHGVLKAQAD